MGGWLVFYSCGSLFFGSLGIALFQVGVQGMALGAAAVEADPNVPASMRELMAQQQALFESVRVYTLVDAATAMALGAALLVCGIGVIRGSSALRKGAVAVLLLKIAGLLAMGIYQIVWQMPEVTKLTEAMTESMAAPGVPNPLQGMNELMTGFNVAGAVIGLILVIAIAAVSLVLVGLRSTRQWCRESVPELEVV